MRSDPQALAFQGRVLREDAIATLHLLKADIPHKYPNIRFHIAHLGGDLAFLAQRIEDNYEDWDSFEHSPTRR